MSGPTRSIPGHFARWATARRLVARIQAHISRGGAVIVSTYTKAWQFDARHATYFKASPSGAFMRRGKSWDCIDGCAIRFH